MKMKLRIGAGTFALALALALASLIALPTQNLQAQEGAQGTEEKLNFSPEQALRLKMIAQGMKAAVNQIRNDASLSDQDKAMKIDNVMRKGKALINETLTPEQRRILATTVE